MAEKNTLISNVSEGVEFFLRGAKKRRYMAISSVRQINSNLGVNLKLVPQVSEIKFKS